MPAPSLSTAAISQARYVIDHTCLTVPAYRERLLLTKNLIGSGLDRVEKFRQGTDPESVWLRPVCQAEELSPERLP